MLFISYNIGYEISYHGNSTLNLRPITYICDDMRDFTSMIRRGYLVLADWAIQNNVPRSSLVLYVNIDRPYMENGEEWIWTNEFKIKCANIREYSKIMSLPNTDIEALIRESKINDIIDENI